MADIDLKTATPDTSLPTTGFLFGADSQAASAPSVYSTQTVATTLLGSTSLTGATITTSQPVLDLEQTWNASGVTFTGLRFNAATGSSANSAAGSLLMDLRLEGTSRFSVNKSGQIDAAWNGVNFLRLSAADYQVFNGANRNLIMGGNAQGLGLNPAWSVSWSSSSTDAFASRDLFLTRRAAANLRLGAADVGATTATVTITIAAPGVVTWSNHGFSTGTPVVFTTTGALPTGITAGTTYYAVVVDANTFQIASSVANAIATPATVITTSGTQSGTHTGTRYNITQRLGMQSVTGVTDRLGADLIIQGSQGTGTGAGGSIIFQVAPAGTTGTAQNALATALTINSSQQALVGDGSNTAPPFSFSGRTGMGFYRAGSQLVFADSSADIWWTGASTFIIRNNGAIGFSSGTGPGTSADTLLYRDTSNTLALRNGTNAQESRIYGSYTDATNYQRMSIKTLRESSGALSGASYTTTIAIPAYANLIGVTTRVTTAVTGATSYSVGDGTTVGLWGATIGVTLGSQSRTADFTAVGAVGAAATSRTVTLTANGSNFTGGVVEICLHYLTTEAD